MSLDPGVSTLLVNEYGRFTQAISDLSDGGEQRALQQLARQGRGGSPAVTAPGWSDYANAGATAAAFSGALGGAGVLGTASLQLGPALQVTKADYSAHYGALARGERSPLSPELQAAIAARADMAARMAASPQPQWAQAAGQALTAIDNVQDMMTTLATFGQLALPLLGPGARFAGPILGGIMVAGDLLNLVAKLGALAVPGYALLCGGVSAALAAGVPAILFGKIGKGHVTNAGRLNPFSRGAKAVLSRRGRPFRPSLANWIEVAQTSQSMFAYGIAFGGAVAIVADAAFASFGAPVGAGGGLRTPRFVARYAELFADVARPMNRAQLRLARAACGALVWAPMFLDQSAPFTIEERADALVAAWWATDVLNDVFDHPGVDGALELLEAEAFTPPGYSRLSTADELRAGGVAVPDGRAWPLPGAPRSLPGMDYLTLVSHYAERGLWDTLLPVRNAPAGLLMGAVASALTDRLLVKLGRSEDWIRWELTPGWALAESLILGARAVNLGQGDEGNQRFLDLAVARIEATGRKLLPPDELDALAAEAGVSLLVLLPPDARPAALAGLDPLTRPG